MINAPDNAMLAATLDTLFLLWPVSKVLGDFWGSRVTLGSEVLVGLAAKAVEQGNLWKQTAPTN